MEPFKKKLLAQKKAAAPKKIIIPKQIKIPAFLSNPKHVVLSVGIATALVIFVWGAINVMPGIFRMCQLSMSPGVVLGEVSTLYPERPTDCEYRFMKDNLPYVGAGRSCGQMGVGERLTIYYLKDNPDISINGDPKQWLIDDSLPFFAALLLLPLIAAYLTHRILHPKQRAQKKA